MVFDPGEIGIEEMEKTLKKAGTYIRTISRADDDKSFNEAQGIADAQKIINSGLSDKLIQFESIKVQKELVSSPNSKIIILGGGKSSPPLFIGQ